MKFFERHGQSLTKANDSRSYKPGEIVAWKFNNGLTHIGLVSSQKSSRSGNYLIVHNIGSGPKLEDVLFKWKIIGHYRYETSNLNFNLSINSIEKCAPLAKSIIGGI